jgi:hypothetical protein
MRTLSIIWHSPSILIILLVTWGSFRICANEKPQDIGSNTSFREKIREMENRYNSLGRRIDSLIIKKGKHAPQQTLVPKGISSPRSLGPYKTGQESTTETINANQIKRQNDTTWYQFNSISLSYGVTLPHETNIKHYNLENDNGYQLQIAYYRNFQNFMLGFKLDSKFYETSGVQFNGVTFKEGVSGDNFLIQGAVFIGKDYYFNDYFYTSNTLSLGMSYADNQLLLFGSDPINEDSTQIIGGLRTGLGIQLHENFSALFYYQLDAIPSRKSWGSQFFSHFGISGNIKY